MAFNHQHNQVYHTPSSMYTYFSDQAVKEGLWNGRGMGGGEILRDIREEIQIELEKERIREQIVAKEIVRMRDMEAKVRREMAMHNGVGISSPYMLQPPLSLNNPSEPGIPRGQSEEKYGGTGRHRQEIGGFEGVPFQRLPWSSEDDKNNVIDMEMPNGAAPPPAGSSELNHVSPHFWNENGSRLHGEWGFGEGPWGR